MATSRWAWYAEVDPSVNLALNYTRARVIGEVVNFKCTTVPGNQFDLNGNMAAACISIMPLAGQLTSVGLWEYSMNKKACTEWVKIQEGLTLTASPSPQLPFRPYYTLDILPLSEAGSYIGTHVTEVVRSYGSADINFVKTPTTAGVSGNINVFNTNDTFKIVFDKDVNVCRDVYLPFTDAFGLWEVAVNYNSILAATTTLSLVVYMDWIDGAGVLQDRFVIPLGQRSVVRFRNDWFIKAIAVF